MLPYMENCSTALNFTKSFFFSFSGKLRNDDELLLSSKKLIIIDGKLLNPQSHGFIRNKDQEKENCLLQRTVITG